MRKEKLVTRTFTLTPVTIMTVDTVSAEIHEIDDVFTGDLTPAVAEKKAKAIYETDTLKVVKVDTFPAYTELRGMTEQCFYEYSKMLPDRKDYSKEEGED